MAKGTGDPKGLAGLHTPASTVRWGCPATTPTTINAAKAHRQLRWGAPASTVAVVGLRDSLATRTAGLLRPSVALPRRRLPGFGHRGVTPACLRIRGGIQASLDLFST